MDITSCMKKKIVSIPDTARIRDAAAVFVQRHVGMLPVVDKDHRPIGVVALPDMLTLELPDFVKFVADVDFVRDFGAVETTRPTAGALAKSIKTLMRPATCVPENCGLLRAYALMLQHDLHDILIVSKEGRLIGIASRVDIGSAILSAWSSVGGKR
ncbi:MAG: HPP family protein [Bacteroidota bacterium]